MITCKVLGLKNLQAITKRNYLFF